jgi:hypothetical protein
MTVAMALLPCDACQVRKGAAPHVLAVFDVCKISNAKQYMRSLDAHPLQAARLLLKSLEEN